MDRGRFCRQSRVLVVAGKGGVGKTTVTAALARMAADAGLDVLVVGLDDAGALPLLFGADVTFGYDEVLLYSAAGGRGAEAGGAAAAAAGAGGGAEAGGAEAGGVAAGEAGTGGTRGGEAGGTGAEAGADGAEAGGAAGLALRYGGAGRAGAAAVAGAGSNDDAGSTGAGRADGAAPGGGRVQGRVITPDDALLEYLMDHGLRRVAKRLVSTGVLDVVSTAIPGIREILVLGKVKQLERADTPDLLVLDAPATGHAVRFLTSANGLMDAARGGPLRTQAAEVVEMLHDPERLQVILVTLPEETPVNELVETAFRLEDEVGVMLGPVVVNACYPPVAGVGAEWLADPLDLASLAGVPQMDAGEAGALRGAAGFRASREAVQSEQIDRLSADMPLPQLRLPYLFSDDIGPEQVAELAEALGRAIDELDADELAAAVAGEPAESVVVDAATVTSAAGGVPVRDDGPGSDEAVSS
jgi:anion-transporting  ArsA/GET3 family ATPase